jgi:hypothetical protein
VLKEISTIAPEEFEKSEIKLATLALTQKRLPSINGSLFIW